MCGSVCRLQRRFPIDHVAMMFEITPKLWYLWAANFFFWGGGSPNF